jgi:hypothetical protein
MKNRLKKKSFSWIETLTLGAIILFLTHPLAAQNTQSYSASQLQPLRSGVKLYDFAGNLQWQTYYSPSLNSNLQEYLKIYTQSMVQVQFRQLFLLNAHVGVGYRVFGTAYVEGFFNGFGTGGAVAGPVLRVYPLKTTRWQPYLQAGFIGGYDLGLSDAAGIEHYKGASYRSGLRAGLNYRFTNAFSLFLEIGPEWEYDSSFQLDAHALQIDVGIELFQF